MIGMISTVEGDGGLRPIQPLRSGRDIFIYFMEGELQSSLGFCPSEDHGDEALLGGEIVSTTTLPGDEAVVCNNNE